jgi:hypothetical protein
MAKRWKKIVKGKYTGRVSTFMEPAGVLAISAKVDIQGDSKPYHMLCLASLKHAKLPVLSANTTHSNGSPTVHGNPADLESVIQKVSEIEELLMSLKLDIEKIRSSSMSQ